MVSTWPLLTGLGGRQIQGMVSTWPLLTGLGGETDTRYGFYLTITYWAGGGRQIQGMVSTWPLLTGLGGETDTRYGFYLTITYWAGGGIDRYKVWFLPDHHLPGWGGRQIQGMVSTWPSLTGQRGLGGFPRAVKFPPSHPPPPNPESQILGRNPRFYFETLQCYTGGILNWNSLIHCPHSYKVLQ